MAASKERQELLEKFLMSQFTFERITTPKNDGFLKQYRLTGPQMELLYWLSALRGCASIKDTATMLNITSGAATQLVDSLVRRGLLERCVSNSDRRYVDVELSEAGKTFFAEFRKAHLNHAHKVLETLRDSDLQTITSARQRVIDHFREKRIEDRRWPFSEYAPVNAESS
jgi:DNA-binding MarR family transcriptional regulator